jgi:thioredoxin-related protein
LLRIFKTMKRIISLLLVTLLGTATWAQTTEDLPWLNKVDKAHVQSQATGKPIFAFFTGSDWCGWCHKLQREVFAKPAFHSWAEQNVVLLELDFPAKKAMPDSLANQNAALKNFFQVRGFPTIWLFCINEDKQKANSFVISAFGSLGYPQNPVKGKEEESFLKTANSILASNKCR